jgi:hypothetical protein
MPTKSQLSKIRESQFEYFWGGGQPVQTYGVSFDENGLTTKQHTDTPLITKQSLSESNGEVIGTITL